MDRPAAAELRQTLRRQRRALATAVQGGHARAVARWLMAHPKLQRARRVGLYLAVDGELALEPLRRRLLAAGILPLLPVLGTQTLAFRPWRQGSAMRKNRYGIAEPLTGPTIPVDALDVLLLPLTACDRRGNRLGMGAGWYDRTLARCSQQGRCPWNVGVAHALQRVPQLEPAPWDVPLDALVTEQGLTDFSRRIPWPTG